MKDNISGLISTVSGFINKGQKRSVKAKKNIVASFFIKGVSITISLLIVPITINYINPSRYGIWLTLSSIVAWFSFFNIGLTQGLRNKFAEAKAKGDDELAQILVSTTYAILSIIFLVVWGIFLLVNPGLNWSQILKVPEEMASEISTLAVIIFSYFCLQFVLKIITTLIIADQQPAKASLIDVLGQVLSLIIIVVLVKISEGSLIKLGLALCLSPITILLGANLFFFSGSLRRYRPKFSKIKFHYAKSLFNLGIIFFVIQIAGIIQFQTALVIIARNFGTVDVTNYNIVYKYFGMLNMLFVIFLSPFWSASTEAYYNNDINWIRKAIKKYNKLFVLLVGIGGIMLLFSQQLYDLWLKKGTVNIEFTLSLWGYIYFVLTMFASTYVYFLNGINALRIQFIACIFSPVIYIGCAFLLILYFKMGVYALFIASIIANFNGFILSPLQYHMIIIKKKKGIWVK